ncbi:DNA cytosine methyltransferase [Cellvibrio sp. QJXJ]|uniref:DNA cytosine methyltransferase n=1 Tax=Cellvibrio sp. QJXJ TaxID=2964606 RepID=UPI0021C3A839|nr:DNA cytosine methyltransferase [Cellvibrio sp. QJXJ]UUA75164.1 DNA cytosine methyltransferase [Cellvibrio sp. QJXJ]
MASVAVQHIYRKVADYRGAARIWISGAKMGAAGFTFGQPYTVERDFKNEVIKIKLDPTGDRTVSGKKNKNNDSIIPIIDLNGKKTKLFAKSATRVRIDIHHGELSISIHHLDRKKVDREEAFINHAAEGRLTKGSLCCGIGVAAVALADGLQDVGIKSSLDWLVDREAKYLQVAIDNNYAVTKATKVIEGSLEEIEEDLLPQTDLVQFSLPCTSHSKAGKAKNKIKIAEEHNKDATAVFGLVKILQKTNAAIYVSENVVEAMKSATYTLLKSMLSYLGYNIYEMLLDEEQAGSFEARKRYWFIAVSAGLPAIDVSKIESFDKVYGTLGELVEPNEVTNSLWRKHDYLDAKQEHDIAEGKGFRRALYTNAATKINVIGRSYMKRRSSEPFIVNEQGLERLLTPIEHCRVKGIPECLIKNVFDTTAHEGLGQSILFNHARGIGRLLGNQLFVSTENVVSIFSAKKERIQKIKPIDVYRSNQLDIFA